MDCKAVMAPIKTSLYADDPAGTAIDFMVEKHMGLVPVTERDGKFAGLISGDGLIALMLPKALTSMTDIKGGLPHAGYLHETAGEMRERLDALRHKPIRELVDRNVKVAHLDTPLTDALMLIKHRQYVVPVVDDDHKLVGAISFFSVLYALREEYDREAIAEAKARERAERKKTKEDSS